MEQTAVTWLYDEIKHIIPNVFLGKFEQAKKIEKQQIIDAHDNGYIDGGNKKKITAEQYYKETFKQNN